MGVKMNFRRLSKDHAADSKIGFYQKIDLKAIWTHEFHPTVSELKNKGPKMRYSSFLSPFLYQAPIT